MFPLMQVPPLYQAMLRMCFFLYLTCFCILFILSSSCPANPQVYTCSPCVPLPASSPSSDLISGNPRSLCFSSLPLSYRPLIDLLFLVLLIILFLNTFPIMVYLPPISLVLVKLYLFLFPSLCLRPFRIHNV